MDPEVTYRELVEAIQCGDWATARERAVDLQAWLRRGGFYPPDQSQADVDANLRLVLVLTSAPKFRLGRIVITSAAAEAIETAEVSQALARHVAGDWGDLDEQDRRENELSLQQGFRLLSAYHTLGKTKFWIITEADRSATTVLLPSDY